MSPLYVVLFGALLASVAYSFEVGHQYRMKRQIPGGESDGDPTDPKYQQMAIESLAKFSETNPGGPIEAKEIKVTKVTHQVVSGSMTRLTFTVVPKNGEEFTCHSKIWEQPWLNKKEITVTCDMDNKE